MMRSKCRGSAKFLRAAGLVFVVAIAGVSGSAWAQGAQSCGGFIDPIVLDEDPPIGVNFVGDTVRVQLRLQAGSIQGGMSLSIDTLNVALDCANDGPFPCTDEGEIISYQGNITSDCQTEVSGPVTWGTSTHVPGDTIPNVVVFIPEPAPVFLDSIVEDPANSFCLIAFDVRIESLGTDNNRTRIEGAQQYQGACDNGLTGGGNSTTAIDVEVCDVAVDRQVSCDNGSTWNDIGFDDSVIDGCTTVNGAPILVRYLAQNRIFNGATGEGSNAPLENCMLMDSNGAVLAGPQAIGQIGVPFEGVIFEVGPLTCGDDLTAGEPGTARLVCDCAVPDSGVTVEDEDTAEFDCEECAVEVDKQVSCDGGGTWKDPGFAPDTDPLSDPVEFCEATFGDEVLVRYQARNAGRVDLESCFITDSNGLIQPLPIQVGGVAVDGVTGFFPAAGECSPEFYEFEPNTGTVQCECATPEGVTVPPVTDTDRAEIGCRGVCEVFVDRQVSCDNGVTWEDPGFAPDTDPLSDPVEGCSTANDAPVLVRYLANAGLTSGDLSNCFLTDSNGAVLAGQESIGTIAQGTTELVIYETSPLECSAELDEFEPGTARLVCDCPVGFPEPTVEDTDRAFFDCQECDVEVDKQVSCDGLTWYDEGFPEDGVNGCDTLNGEPVYVRYQARNVGEVDLLECEITDSNGEILPIDEAIAVGGIAVDGQTEFFPVDGVCSDELEAGEPNTGTVTCACANPADVEIEVDDFDRATIECLECDVDLTKEVSCDDGVTFIDAASGCSAPSGDPIIVRYRVDNPGEVDLENCVITDSNGLILAGLGDQIVIPGVDVEAEAVEDVDLICSDELDDAEPDTATVVCDCASPPAPDDFQVEDTDDAGFTCGEINEICRTPGFWGTHALGYGEPGCRKRRAQNITQAVIDANGGALFVCGHEITNTSVDYFSSAVEGICVSPSGEQELQLARQLTAAALNCVISGATTDCDGISIEELYSECNTLCTDISDGVAEDYTSAVTDCIERVDCFNNGGRWSNGAWSCTYKVCSDSGEPCRKDEDCDTTAAAHELDGEQLNACVPIPGNCHDRALCPADTDFDGEPDDPDGLCFDPPGPACSSHNCNDAIGNECDIVYDGCTN